MSAPSEVSFGRETALGLEEREGVNGREMGRSGYTEESLCVGTE